MGRSTKDGFVGEYDFLSNFYRCTPPGFWYDNHLYFTAEHAFQASKCALDIEAARIRDAPTPALAKTYGHRCKLIEHWDILRLGVMKAVVLAKFQMPELRVKLLNTGDVTLVEYNKWRDRFWGVYDGWGENHLGRILMEVRTQFQYEERTRAFQQK